MGALELAIDNTPSEIFNEKSILVYLLAQNRLMSPKEYGSTLGETAPLSGSEEHIEDERNNSLNKHLFESVGEVTPTDIPEVEPVVRPEQKYEHENVADTAPPKSNGRVVNFVPPTVSEPDEPVALDKKVMNKFVFVIPVIIL